MTGEQLHQLGGVAAVLRFPLDIDIEEEDVPNDEVGGCVGGNMPGNLSGLAGSCASIDPVIG